MVLNRDLSIKLGHFFIKLLPPLQKINGPLSVRLNARVKLLVELTG